MANNNFPCCSRLLVIIWGEAMFGPTLGEVLNKIDLPGADPQRVCQEIEEIVGLDCSEAILCSAKEGIGVHEILEAIVKKIPPPQNTAEKPLRALIFDRQQVSSFLLRSLITGEDQLQGEKANTWERRRDGQSELELLRDKGKSEEQKAKKALGHSLSYISNAK
eukprot:Gb_36641 [translate_table: standard]